MRLPSFPRRALEADFGLYNGVLGKVSTCNSLFSTSTRYKFCRLCVQHFSVVPAFKKICIEDEATPMLNSSSLQI